jgi:hypothetical protein
MSNPSKGVGYNSVNDPNDVLDVEISWCIGSDCMMWRWYSGTPKDERGYCGLAGKPYAMQ